MDILIDTDQELLDFVLNRHRPLKDTFKLRKPAFAEPENVDHLFDHSHPLLTEFPQKTNQTPVDLSKVEWKRVKLPGIPSLPKLQFPPQVQAKKRIFLDNLKQFPTTGGKVNLLTEITDDLVLVVDDHPHPQREPDTSEEKKLAAEFLRLNLKTVDSDFGTLIKVHGGQMGKGHYKWAHLVPQDKVFNIHPRDMALKLDFQLDTFQSQAIHYLSAHKNVFVAAHTSSGKTVIAEYAVALSDLHNTNTIYTSPIKALSNQKYRDFSKKFSKQKIGLITGDVQINVNYEGASTSLASRHANSDCSQPNICTIMTTEILLTMLYKNEKFLKNVEFVVFDECHYINDDSRGYVWEEIFILLPSHITIVMLSATIPNLMEFNEWIGELKSRDIYIVKTARRPIPLEYYVVAPQYIKNSNITGSSKKSNNDNNLPVKKQASESAVTAIAIGRSPSLSKQTGNDPFSVLIHCTSTPNHFEDYKLSEFNRNIEDQLAKAKGRLRDAQIYLQTVRFLSTVKKLPAVVFVLSRKRCDDLAFELDRQNLNLLDSETERHFINGFLTNQLSKLTKSIGGGAQNHELPAQVHQMKTYLMRGFACHHSGLLQSLKEIVELLFQMGYVKLLFATETFAIGVNMPTRTVVFDSLQKFDGRERRLLTPVEYTQMAGRAGRRGQDDFGTVLMLIKKDYFQPSEMRQLCLTNIENNPEIKTQFQLNYKLLLNIIRTNELPDPKGEDYATKYEAILHWNATWTVKPQQASELLSNSTLSIEKFLKFNFFEYQRTLKGAKLDNFRMEVWQLVDTLIYKRFFGYFEENRAVLRWREFFEEKVQRDLVIPKWGAKDDKVACRENIQLEFVILNVELQRLRDGRWKHFVRQQSQRLFSNGRLLRFSANGFDRHFAICVGGAVDAKLRVLVYRRENHSDKSWEDWMAESQAEDVECVRRLTKFLNRFGCALWKLRENKPVVEADAEEGGIDDADVEEKYLSDHLLEEDKQLLEILNSFLKINLKYWTSNVPTGEAATSIDWKNVARMVFSAAQQAVNDNPESVWWERDSMLESIFVELKDVEEVYDLAVLPKHDLSKDDSYLKIKASLEREVTERGGIQEVVNRCKLPWIDLLHSSEGMEHVQEVLDQRKWLQCRLKEHHALNVDLLSDTFSSGKKATRYLHLCRARYEPKLLSDKYNLENLKFYMDYREKLKVLQRLDYVTPGSEELTLKVKGKMASELSNQKLPNELLLTEIIFDGFAVDLSEAELCALLSCTLCTAKIDDDKLLELWQVLKKEHPKLLEKFQVLERIFQHVQEVEKQYRVNEDESGKDTTGELNLNLMLVVFNWASGKSYVECKNLTDIQDGIIVRCVQNLIELLRDIRNAAHSFGEPVLFNKINAAINLVKRDIIFAPSLYTI